MSEHCPWCFSGQERTITCPLCRLPIRCTWQPCTGLQCKGCAAKDAEIARLGSDIAMLTARNVSQREQLVALEELQDGEIAEHVRLAEEAKDKEIARLTAELKAQEEKEESGMSCPQCNYLYAHDHSEVEDLHQRISALEAKLAEVTAERDNLLGLYEQYTDALTQMVRVEQEADTLRAALTRLVEASQGVHDEMLDRPDGFDIDESVTGPFADALAHAKEVLLDGR